ncbi:DUF3499 domain-containing protein [Corynebacterium sp. 320]|uniref:DUF3499 domain-containing protein n=1 Tax=Corynebacterium TaxID=1716 RepID=UPI00125CC7AD|nr:MULTISPECIES: DUF3499 domain-containing protein [Corynebacterium]KAB1504176.1 DUF3499 domain-containing protein [Corynebacterium sp. 320]KAB1552724.1 DUF3499 domain-containing protein [Corynebacterium sp. 321]KAB1554058.1 DUF3499 domain-containing protein [Corynebacterium sp. 319]KAB3528312.1 DUF3499 domain-containing protein [Corynebacterium sp. 250]KAB3540199.1 DUF3499 domain-containing protein [Corynebacterium sp. 366]
MTPVTLIRQCSRPGCCTPAIATLEFNYASQMAIIGPLIAVPNPHRWDLCEEHARRTTAPHGWQLSITNPYLLGEAADIDDDELSAMAEAVRHAHEHEAADSIRLKELEEEHRASRVQRRDDHPVPTGLHPARRNLPRPTPRRHLRAVRND